MAYFRACLTYHGHAMVCVSFVRPSCICIWFETCGTCSICMLECVYTLASMGGCWPMYHTIGTSVHPRLAWGILDLVRSSTVPMRFGIRVVCPCSVDCICMMHDVRATTVAALLMLGTAHTMPSTCDVPTGSLSESTVSSRKLSRTHIARYNLSRLASWVGCNVMRDRQNGSMAQP